MTLEDFRRSKYDDFQLALSNMSVGLPSFNVGDEYVDGLLTSYAGGMSARQVQISFNKWVHGFNLTDVDADIALLVGELAEVLEARSRKNDYDTALELADVAIYCYGIAQMLNYDLDTAIKCKMEDFFHRTYKPDVMVEE